MAARGGDETAGAVMLAVVLSGSIAKAQTPAAQAPGGAPRGGRTRRGAAQGQGER